MGKVPTIKEFTLQYTKEHGMDENWLENVIKEYSKLKVMEALEIASKKTTYGMLVIPLFNEEQQKSILNSIPEDLK